jgi:hypothetical protein
MEIQQSGLLLQIQRNFVRYATNCGWFITVVSSHKASTSFGIFGVAPEWHLFYFSARLKNHCARGGFL